MEAEIERLKGDVAFHKDDKQDLKKTVQMYEDEMTECDKVTGTVFHSERRIKQGCTIF